MNGRVLFVALFSRNFLADLLMTQGLRLRDLLLADETGNASLILRAVNGATYGLALGHALKLLVGVGLIGFNALLDFREGNGHLRLGKRFEIVIVGVFILVRGRLTLVTGGKLVCGGGLRLLNDGTRRHEIVETNNRLHKGLLLLLTLRDAEGELLGRGEILLPLLAVRLQFSLMLRGDTSGRRFPERVAIGVH